MSQSHFDTFFQDDALHCLQATIDLALAEDGADLTSQALFRDASPATGRIVAKQETIVAGLPIAHLVLETVEAGASQHVRLHAAEGETVPEGTVVAEITCAAATLLRAERVILNFVGHLSGIANLTREYARLLSGTRTTLLDTRKTLPGLRYPEKYAVLLGGGKNHRMNLAQMLMLKDNHIDRAGGITPAVQALRAAYSPCPPMEVECRTEAEVIEAAGLMVDRIMLDNMPAQALAGMLARIPQGIETEVSGGVNLNTIREIAEAGPDFVSVGRLTHSAPGADFSMRIHLGE